jgi:hypothetical protein
MLHLERRHEALASPRVFRRRLVTAGALGTAMVAISLAIGIAGYMFFEALGALDAFLNAAMILSGMGPLHTPVTTGGKVFAALYALYSGFRRPRIAGVIFAPVAHRIFHRFHLAEEDLQEEGRKGGRKRRRAPPAEAVGGYDTPSRSSKRPLLLARRMSFGFSYSGESHHFLAASIEGNSMITRRTFGQSPSRASVNPPARGSGRRTA